MKETVSWCKVFLMTLIADWNLKGLHTRPDGQNSHPLICRGFRAAHWSDREKWGGGLLTLLEFDCTVSANSLMFSDACIASMPEKWGLHWTKQEQSALPQPHVTQLARAAVWRGFGAHWELSVSVRQFTEPFSLGYRGETALTHRLRLM